MNSITVSKSFLVITNYIIITKYELLLNMINSEILRNLSYRA